MKSVVQSSRLLFLVGLIAINALLCIGLAGASAQKPGAKGKVEEAKTATVPFEMLPSNHMVVRAKINGKGPYRLVFDLGAPITLLGNRPAESSGTVDKKAPKSFLFAMRGEGKVKTLEVGTLKADDVPVVIFDHPALKALGSFFSGPLDGIIGFTFFARYKTTIDYQAKEMTFTPVDYRIRDLMKDLPDRLSGPKTAKERMLNPTSLFGIEVGEARDDEQGVPITKVMPESPAAEAGLKVGDVLTTLDGRWVTNPADAHDAAERVTSGKTVDALILRDGKEVTVKVVPREGI